MNDNEKNPLNWMVQAANWVIDVLARLLVGLFDGLKNAIDHANPSMFALVATLLPYAIPLPVAFMTSHSAQHFFGWETWAANTLGFGLEGLGLLAWVKLVDAVLDYVRSANGKITTVVVLYGMVALVYEILLLFVNVVLARQDGADWRYTVVLGAICLLPALSALVYGHQRATVTQQLDREKEEARALAEKIRQERRGDRKEAQALKIQYAKDVERPAIKPFRK